jgi:hypothetical protein
MKKTKKHPKDMTTDEAISHIFHPDVLEHLKKHVENIGKKKKKTVKKDQ